MMLSLTAFFLLLLQCPAVVSGRQIPSMVAWQGGSHAFSRKYVVPISGGTKSQAMQTTDRASVGPPIHSSLTRLRAGAISLPVLASTTAKLTSAFLGINGILLIARPSLLLEQVYKITPSDDERELTTWELRGIGSLGLGVAAQVYASIVGGLSPLTSMGIGLIPRAIFFVYTLFSGKMKSLNIQPRFFTMNTALTCWCIASLLLGLGKPVQTAKTYSLMCLLKSFFFVWAPKTISKKLLGKPCEGKSLGLVRGAGNELLTSAVLMVLAAWGSHLVDPVSAAGYTSLLWVVLLGDMAVVDKTWRLMGSDNAQAQWVNMVFAGFFACGFHLAKR